MRGFITEMGDMPHSQAVRLSPSDMQLLMTQSLTSIWRDGLQRAF